MSRLLLAPCMYLLMTASTASAQDAVFIKDRSVTMPAGPQYKASGWKQLWWGKHYRPEWQAPVSFPVLDLDATAGGLTATIRGGGHQSMSLRMMGANGKEYVMRSVDKSLDVLIPEMFKGSYINDIVNDQISTAHPYGPIAVAYMAKAIGIYHTNPVIVQVPSSPRLKEHEKDFAGKLVLFEERTSGKGWENTAVTGYADDVINTVKLLDKLNDDNDRRVDQKAFLKVRFFDMIINDWDRHEDQWVWLEHRKNGKTIYAPLARDRDQSFSKTDGINLYFLSRPWMLASVQNLDKKVKNVVGTALAARFMDRQFLNQLTYEDWVQVVYEVQQLMTDQVIHDAIYTMPPNIVAISGEDIIERLKARRDDLMRFGLRYFDILNKEVDITGTDKKEMILIDRVNANDLHILIRKLKNGSPGDTVFNRTFHADETKKIYIYGLGGNDDFKTTGEGDNPIRITLIGGEGKDEYLADTDAGKRIRVYDEKSNKEKTGRIYKAHFTTDTSFTNYNRKRFQYDWAAPQFLPGYNPDDGFSMGVRMTYKKKAWAKNPYASIHKMGVGVSFLTGATDFFYSGRYTKVFGKWDVTLDAAHRGPKYVFNFYGYGNESVKQSDDLGFYRVSIRQWLFNPGIARSIGRHDISMGLISEQLRVKANDSKFISNALAGVDPRVFRDNNFLGADIHYRYTKKNNNTYPTKGLTAQADITYKANVTGGKKNFTNLRSSVSFYVPLGPVVLAHRTGGATNIGDFEFYHANTLGSSENLRGFYRTRFTGKSAVYQNTELRWAFANLKGYVFRGKLGLIGFVDDGRVWMENDSSDKIHIAYGGGLFFLPFNAAALNLSYGISDESKILRVGMSMFF